MGLAGPKNRNKIGKDPNNTEWSNKTSRFGHQILLSQGWTPGSTLGAENANHEAHYTAASSSHIKVMLKDGNLGIGAKRGKGPNDETFGLTLLNGLLGRINGKSDAVLQKEKNAMRDVKLLKYQGDKWGTVGFHFGGYLIGDKVEKTIDGVDPSIEGQLRKRKRGEDGLDSNEEGAKDKRKKKSKRNSEVKEDLQTANAEQVSTVVDDEHPKEAKRRRKEEKRARKEARRLRKEAKRAAKESSDQVSSASDTDKAQNANDRQPTSAVVSATPSGASTPLFAGGRGRHAIRQKYIQQKQMACLDDKALNEIFMIKPVA